MEFIAFFKKGSWTMNLLETSSTDQRLTPRMIPDRKLAKSLNFHVPVFLEEVKLNVEFTMGS